MLKEIQTLAESSETFSLPLSVLQCNLGTKVMNRYLTHTKQQQGITSKVIYRFFKIFYISEVKYVYLF